MSAQVGPRLVRACVEMVVEQRLRAEGRSLGERSALPTPRYLGLDEFARRKGQRYDTLLCDLERRRVLEVSGGRTLTEVACLLERLDDPEQVEAVSMDMSLTFRARGSTPLFATCADRRRPLPCHPARRHSAGARLSEYPLALRERGVRGRGSYFRMVEQ